MTKICSPRLITLNRFSWCVIFLFQCSFYWANTTKQKKKLFLFSFFRFWLVWPLFHLSHNPEGFIMWANMWTEEQKLSSMQTVLSWTHFPMKFVIVSFENNSVHFFWRPFKVCCCLKHQHLAWIRIKCFFWHFWDHFLRFFFNL